MEDAAPIPRRPAKIDPRDALLWGHFFNHVWSYDFVEAETHDGRKLRLMTLIDEFIRECLAIRIRETRLSTLIFGGVVPEGGDAHVLRASIFEGYCSHCE
jgi:hypothetical protein